MNSATGRARATWDRLGTLEKHGRFHPRWVDIAIAGFVLFILSVSDATIVELGAENAPVEHWHWVTQPLLSWGLIVVGLLAGSIPLIVRRLYPVPVFLITLAGALIVSATPWHDIGGDLGALIALGTIAAYRPLKQTLVFAGIFLAVAVPVIAIERQFSDWPSVLGDSIGAAIIVAAAVGIGYAIAQRRRSRKAELVSAELRGREAVAEERARIARELHDVVAHGVSVMTVQAGGARMSLDQDPARAREALHAIETTGRESLTEMRRLLDVLRGDDEGGGDRPQPGIDDIPELVNHTRSAGLPVALTSSGEPLAISPGLALTVYRVVQESLTNIIKHAGPAEARVVLEFTDDSITIDVNDNGVGLADDAVAGHGLAGMRERVALFGGTVETGAAPAGGFRVHAVIPVERES